MTIEHDFDELSRGPVDDVPPVWFRLLMLTIIGGAVGFAAFGILRLAGVL